MRRVDMRDAGVRRRRIGWAATCAGIAAITAALLGCGSTPPSTPDEPAPRRAAAKAPPAAGEVIASSDRFVIYLPRADDSFKSIAARFLGAEENAWMIADFNNMARPESGQALTIPLQPLNRVGVYADHYQTVPILCYHRFGNTSNNKMVVSAAAFAAQLDWLSRNDYQVLRLSQLPDYLNGKRPLPKRSVVITIDDGYESVHRFALPLLKKYNFPATLYVYSDFIGAPAGLNWAQLGELAGSGLVDIESHSKTHRNLLERAPGDGDDRYRQMLELEARAPRDLLEKRLPVQVRHFAYPYGDTNDQMLDVLTRQRYQTGVTVNPGGNAFFSQPLMLRRTMIFGDHSIDDFKAKLQISRLFSAP